MRAKNSAITKTTIAVSPPRPPSTVSGTVLAIAGVTTFSLTFPATAWALEGFGPWSVTSLRLGLAGLLAVTSLMAFGARPPQREHWGALAIVACGVVLGFPLLTTLALETSSTSHAAVVVGVLPLATAAYSSWRHGTRHSPVFWGAAGMGATMVAGFAAWESGGQLVAGDLFLLAALLVCAAGYGEGGRLARELPGWQVISWALTLCLPLSLLGVALSLSVEPVELTAHSVLGVAWVACGSQWLGLVVWYRGMAAIGVGRASQLQLAQPLLTLAWSVLLVGEQLGPLAPLTALGVLACIAVTQRCAEPRAAG